MSGAALTGAFVLAAMGAFYLLIGRHEGFARLCVSIGAIVFPAAGAVAIATEIIAQAQGRWGRAFAANCVAIAALLATMAAGVYPDILPARQAIPSVSRSPTPPPPGTHSRSPSSGSRSGWSWPRATSRTPTGPCSARPRCDDWTPRRVYGGPATVERDPRGVAGYDGK